MRKTLILSLLLCCLAFAATEWVERKNVEPDPARPMGWRFEIPAGWRQAPLSNYPYPLGESWEGGDGSMQVCWMGSGNNLGQEQLNLENRGYVREARRVAGRDAEAFVKKTDLYCYLSTPQGRCRIHLTGSTPVTQRILQSFIMLQTEDVVSTPAVRFESWSFTLPTGWEMKGEELVAGGQPVARLSTHSLTREMMVRGWARSEAGQANPKLKERLGMEPFTSKGGVDGYLVEWKGPAGPLLFAYTGQHGKGLRLELLRPREVDRLRRLLSTLQFTPQ